VSIKNKIIGYHSITLITIFIIFIIFSRVLISDYLYAEIKNNLYEEARLTTIFLIENYKKTDDFSESMISSYLQTKRMMSNLKFDSTMKVAYYNKQKQKIINENIRLPQNIITSVEDSISNNNRNIEFEINGMKYFGVIQKIKENTDLNLEQLREKNVFLYIIIYVEATQVKVLTNQIIKKQILIILIALIIVFIIGTFIAKSITKPLRILNKQTKSIAKRNYDKIEGIKGKGEIKQLSLAINKMSVELKEYEQVQNRFLQNASHELKTPLMSIRGYAEGMIDGLVQKNEVNLNIIVDETNRLSKIVEGISFLSKLESKGDYFIFEDISIVKVIKKAKEKIAVLATNSNITLVYDFKTDVVIKIDENKYIQALINIYSNCIRYAKNEINTIVEKRNDNLIITIYDDGKGFSEKDIPYVFERFYKGDKGENGLGLSITRTIIEKNNGNISISNRKDGMGAIYIIKQPL